MSRDRFNKLSVKAASDPTETAPVDAVAPDAPVETAPEPTAVEKQDVVHAQAVVPTPNVLSPGKPEVISDGILGELSALLKAAEKLGASAVYCELHAVELKIAELVTKVREFEKNAIDSVKPLYTKLLELFKL